jgi:hypothetical protein
VANIDAGHQPFTEAISTPSTGALGGLGTAIGLSTLLASSCCVVPLALAGLGASGALFSGLAFLAIVLLAIAIGRMSTDPGVRRAGIVAPVPVAPHRRIPHYRPGAGVGDLS